MKAKIYLIGKIREKFFKDGIEEFKKRLFNSVEVIECEESTIANILGKSNIYKIALVVEGKNISSEEFAAKISEIEKEGAYSEMAFFIGGAEGLPQHIKDKSDFRLSFSKMTFTHQHAVFILIEQIYRARRILNNEPYHK